MTVTLFRKKKRWVIPNSIYYKCYLKCIVVWSKKWKLTQKSRDIFTSWWSISFEIFFSESVLNSYLNIFLALSLMSRKSNFFFFTLSMYCKVVFQMKNKIDYMDNFLAHKLYIVARRIKKQMLLFIHMEKIQNWTYHTLKRHINELLFKFVELR